MQETHNHAALQVGYQLRDYELIKVLGSGAFGIVYLGRHIHLGKKVAIKEYMPDFAIREEGTLVYPRTSGEDTENFQWGLNAFLNEAKTLAQFNHKNIIRVQDFFGANNTAYMVMEYIIGTPLDEILKEQHRLTEHEVKKILWALLDGLKTVHQGVNIDGETISIIHRDIKPANIMIRANGEPVLIDFGAAREKMGEKTQTVIFTPGYGAFEQYSSKGNVGPWTDIYALAATTYHCITGEAPPEASDRLREDPLQRIALKNKTKPRLFYNAIENALAVFEENRPQTINDWETQLKKEAPISENIKEKANEEANTRYDEELGGKTPVQKKTSKAKSKVKTKTILKYVFFIVIVLPALLLTAAYINYEYIKMPKRQEVKQLLGEFVEIKQGDFQMGSPESEAGRDADEKQYPFSVEQDFYIGKHEVTQELWEAVMGYNPSRYISKNHPVESVNFQEVQQFIKKLREITDKQFDLPTEKDWEYAARAGTTSPFNTGQCIDSNQANFNTDNHYNDCKIKKIEAPHHKAVGFYPPNQWGLYDMHGNVKEWTCSTYSEAYKNWNRFCRSSVHDLLVVRGGSYQNTAKDIRSAERLPFNALDKGDDLGFRLVLRSMGFDLEW